MSSPSSTSTTADRSFWPVLLCWIAVALDGFDLVVLGAVIPTLSKTGDLGFTDSSLTTAATGEREFAREGVLYQPELLAETVEEMARKSRKTFRWCRTCRTAKRPEHMQDRLECMACAVDYRGVVH